MSRAASLVKVLAVAALVAGVLAWANPVQAALVGFWNFDDGTAKDSSSKGNNGGLLSGAAITASGHSGNGVQLNGNTSRVNVPVTTGLGLTNQFTIAFWAKATYLGSYPYAILFSNNSDGSARQWFIQGDANGNDQMYMWSDANTAWRKGLGFKDTPVNSWHHYAFTYTGGSVKSYLDGTYKFTYGISGSPNFPSFTNILIGGKNQAWTSWEGVMDDVAIFNVAEDSNISGIMAGTYDGMVSVPEPAALAIWALLGTFGTVAIWRRKRSG